MKSMNSTRDPHTRTMNHTIGNQSVSMMNGSVKAKIATLYVKLNISSSPVI